MFEHYLPNKNEGATVAPKSKFRELNKGLFVCSTPLLGDKIVVRSTVPELPADQLINTVASTAVDN